MMRRLGLVLVLAALAPAGCATVSAGRFTNPSALPSVDVPTAELVARRVLMELRFDLVYPQASEGRVETDPLTGASWFEFWRMDTIGAMESLESSLHTTRRRAVVTVSPKDGGSEVLVKVTKERKSAPRTGPDNIGRAYDLYDTEDSELTRENEVAEEFQWLDMGRDELLEQRILERIHAALK